MQTVHRIVLALGLAAASASSFSATTVYTSSASFLANVAPGSYLNGFNGLADSPPTSFTGSGYSYTLSSAEGLWGGAGTFIGTNQPNLSLTVTFTSGNVTAVGGSFYNTNLSDAFQATSVSLTLSDGTTVAFTPTSAADSFRGFTSTSTITSLTIGAPGQFLYAGIDSLQVGSAVPEPSAAVLMLLGAAGLLAARSRRQA